MKRLLVATLAFTALLVGAVAANAAKPGPGPIATPASVCRALADWPFDQYATFEDCLTTINADVLAYRFPNDEGTALISLDQRCAQFEQGLTDPETGEFFQLTYPFFFGEGEGFPFTQFTAVNHHQCMLTLYAYHAAFVALEG
jgi:hypothetical protein